MYRIYSTIFLFVFFLENVKFIEIFLAFLLGLREKKMMQISKKYIYKEDKKTKQIINKNQYFFIIISTIAQTNFFFAIHFVTFFVFFVSTLSSKKT